MYTSVMSGDGPTGANRNAPADGPRPPEPPFVSDPQTRPPNFNALRHGLRSAAILLPGDDAGEFQRLRRDLFHTYRPRTGDEAACVEAMASQQWRIARCRRWQAVYDAQTDALLTGDSNHLAGHICEPDPHRWMHKSMDCTLQESRLDRLMCRARDKLLLLQKLRRNELIAGAVEREPIFWPSESPAPEADPPPRARELGGNGARPFPARCSTDAAFGESDERIAHPQSGLARPLDTRQGARQRAPTQHTLGARSGDSPRNG